MAQINDWARRSAAERLRQWPHVEHLAEASANAPFVGLVLLGSLSRGDADDLSDVDFIVLASEGMFEDAWEHRHHLHPDSATCWDYPRPPGDRDVAGHRWLTSDFVLFDGLIATPSGVRVADPQHLLVGDERLGQRLMKRDPITIEEMVARKDEIALHEVEQLYGQLKLALRTERRRHFPSAADCGSEGDRG